MKLAFLVGRQTALASLTIWTPGLLPKKTHRDLAFDSLSRLGGIVFSIG
jgi:hypothetical protein